MTDSACWIDTVDDEEFWDLLKAERHQDILYRDKLHLHPPTPQPGSYWINVVRAWALDERTYLICADEW